MARIDGSYRSLLNCLPAARRRPMMTAREQAGSAMRIGLIGTRTMWTPNARCLAAAGHRLTVYDIRPEATAALAGQGAAVANSLEGAAAGAEAVFTSLPGPNEMEAAALDPDRGILATLGRGTTYIDLTTNAPKTIRLVA